MFSRVSNITQPFASGRLSSNVGQNMKIFPQIFRFLVVCYLIQTSIVVFWNVFPVDKSIYDNKEYTLVRGIGRGADMIPVLGLMGLSGEPVFLKVEDLKTGIVEYKSFDLVDDVYSEYYKEFDVELEDWQKAK